MKLLLDTNAFIWWIEAPEKLSKLTQTIIADDDTFVYVSAVAFLEIAIKQAKGRLTYKRSFEGALEINEFIELPLTAKHAYAVRDLPLVHHDPFDRLLVAQAKIENLTLVTSDRILAKYDIPVLEA